MATIVVFGATGRTGGPLLEMALDRGHDVTAFVRDPDKLAVDADRLRVVAGDAYTGTGVADAVAGADAVVSVLGQTSSGPDDLLSVAGGHILDAMESHGVDRFVTLVGAGVRTEDERVSLAGRLVGWLLKQLSPAVLADAEAHVEDVRSRDLAWTVVRAPRLSEESPRGTYEVGDVTPGFSAVSRADVADFMLDAIEEDRYVHKLPKITY